MPAQFSLIRGNLIVVTVDGCRNLAENDRMVSIIKDGLLIVTGAGGHIGSEVCRLLRTAEAKFVAVDVDPGTTKDLTRCDLRLKDQMSRLFQSHPVRAIIHLAAILPSAFHSSPLADGMSSACRLWRHNDL